MKKGFVVLLVIAAVPAARAQTTIDDFSVGMPDYVLPTEPDYGPNGAIIPGPLFDFRTANAANYVGNGTDLFTVSAPGNGGLTASGAGTAGGLLNFGFSNGGAADLTGYGFVSATVSALSAPATGFWGIYSNGYTNYSAKGLTITHTGTYVLGIAGMSGDPVDITDIDSLFLNITVSPGQSITFSNVSALVTPEPAPMGAMGLGLGALALMRRKKGLK